MTAMASSLLADTSDKDLGNYHITTDTPNIFTAERRKTAPNPLARSKRVKSSTFSEDITITVTDSWDADKPTALPLVLEVPVRLNNSGLTEIVAVPEAKNYSENHLPASAASFIEQPEITDKPQSETATHANDLTHTNTVQTSHSLDTNCIGRCPEVDGNHGDKVVDANQNEAQISEADNERIREAKHKRGFVLQELVESERKYVADISILVHKYMDEISKLDLPDSLKKRQKIVFGNVKAILAFHKDKFLPNIEDLHDNPQELGTLFIKYERQLQLYITYCENKPRSEYLVAEYASVFQKLMLKLKQKLQIQDLLIKPVQRIMKYQLLLKDILKYTAKCQEPTITLHKAMDVMHRVPKAANNMMEVGRLDGFEVKLPVHGTVLLQETLPVAVFNIKKPAVRKYRLRRVFLFQRLFIISDLCTSSTKGPYYKYKQSIKLSDMRLVSKVFNEPLSFILSNIRDTNTDTYIQTPTVDVKEEWTREIKSVLDTHDNFLQVLEDPMAQLRINPLGGQTSRATRANTDRPELSQQHHDHPHRSKDNIRQHKTIH